MACISGAAFDSSVDHPFGELELTRLDRQFTDLDQSANDAVLGGLGRESFRHRPVTLTRMQNRHDLADSSFARVADRPVLLRPISAHARLPSFTVSRRFTIELRIGSRERPT